jgi:hypothetical protein
MSSTAEQPSRTVGVAVRPRRSTILSCREAGVTRLGATALTVLAQRVVPGAAQPPAVSSGSSLACGFPAAARSRAGATDTSNSDPTQSSLGHPAGSDQAPRVTMPNLTLFGERPQTRREK